jgi:AcrR family transcriptional regulator
MTRKSSEVRKQEIIQATMEIIAEKGIQNFTMTTLAKRIGITDGALYKHFKSKKEILISMVAEVSRSLSTFMGPQVAMYDDPIEKLQNILRLHLEYLEEHKGVPRILFSEAVHITDQDAKKLMYSGISHYLDFIRGILYRAIQEGRVRQDLDIDVAATAFLGLIQGNVILWSLSDFSFPLAERHAALWQVFAEGLWNDTDDVEQAKNRINTTE